MSNNAVCRSGPFTPGVHINIFVLFIFLLLNSCSNPILDKILSVRHSSIRFPLPPWLLEQCGIKTFGQYKL